MDDALQTHFQGEVDLFKAAVGNDIEEIHEIVDNGFIKEPEDGIMAEMRAKYQSNLRRMKHNEDKDKWSYTNLKQTMKEKPIYATKYNHNLEGAIMNHYQYECKLYLSEDEQTIEIVNRKLKDKQKYMYETTPDEIMQ